MQAVIEIGSHSLLLLVATGPHSRPQVLEEDYCITALGANLTRFGMIDPSAAERTRQVIAAYWERCQALGAEKVLLVATSALREASNREEVLSILSISNQLDLRVLTELEEAALTRCGALSGLQVGNQAVVVDTGGRSTEVTWAGTSQSLPLGCQRATETYLKSDPPGKSEIQRLRAEVASWLAQLGPAPKDTRLICSGGTATTLASLDKQLPVYQAQEIHGHQISCRRVSELLDQLVSMPKASRPTQLGIEPDRAEVLPGGAVILDECCIWHGSGNILVSARGLTWGAWMCWDELAKS